MVSDKNIKFNKLGDNKKVSYIGDEIDEYFYPQSKILKKFYNVISREFFNYDIKDFRKYVWYEDKQSKIIKFGSNISKDRTFIIGSFSRSIVNIEGISCFHKDNLKIFLVQNIFSSSGREFVILEDDKELKFVNGKFYYKGENEV